MTSQMQLRSGPVSLLPEQQEAFKQGVQSIMRQWTALELAVHHGWGGLDSANKADMLIEDVIALFLGPQRVYKDDVTLLLEDIMETDFNTICEDESCDELGDLLCTMWRECGQNKFDLVNNALAREQSRNSALITSQGVDHAGDELDSDDDEEIGAAGDMNMEMMEEAEQRAAAAAPVIDEDGFETITKGRKGKGKPK